MQIDSGIQQTHQLIDKIELRVKNFLKTQSMKSLPQQQPLIFQNLDQNLKPQVRTPINVDKQLIRSEHYTQLENIPPPKMSFPAASQSRTSECHMPLLKEIQEIDQSYKQEIGQLNDKIAELKAAMEGLRQGLSDAQDEILSKQKKIDQLQLETSTQSILIQTLRDENNYLTAEIQKLLNQGQQLPKLQTLQKEVQDERIKSEKLSIEIMDIKQRVEKQRDSAKMNGEFQIVEKLVKKLEEAQEQQMKQSHQFMKCVIQFLEKSQQGPQNGHSSSLRGSSQSVASQHARKSKQSQYSAVKNRK